MMSDVQHDDMDRASQDALRRWLSDAVGPADDFSVRLIKGGRSNLSYRVDHGGSTFVLRRPPFGELLKGAHDVLREFRLLQSLVGTDVPIARPIGACEDQSVLGVPFTLVEFLDGFALRSGDDVAGLAGVAPGAVARNFGATLASLHQLDPERVGRARERGMGHAERQIAVWTRQLEARPTRPLPVLQDLGAYLLECRPEQQHVAIVHGDYRLDNIMLDRDGSVLGVLDWELWMLGDPTIDLGNSLAYWTESAFELFALGESPTADQVLGTRADVRTAYLEAGGPEFSESALDWAVSFGFWRYAVILEGVYRRNIAGAYGETQSDDWRRFEHVVPAMAEIGWQLRPT